MTSQSVDSSLSDIRDFSRGYRRDEDRARLHCLSCAASFDEALVYPVKGGMGSAGRAMEEHVEEAHGGPFAALMAMGREATGLTETQEILFKGLHDGRTDREIAALLGGKSESTVRNHRFQARKREAEAKVLVALMALIAEVEPAGKRPFAYPAALPLRDERTNMTEDEAKAILTRSMSSDGGRILAWPRREKERLVILSRLVERFERGKEYTESEVNLILKPLFDDHVMIRRYLIDYRFLEREPDGRAYWRR